MAALRAAARISRLIFSSFTARAIAAAHRILKPGGRIAILDLLAHQFENAREMYADLWLGFTEVQLDTMLREAGFREVDVSVVDREPESPYFQTVKHSPFYTLWTR